MRGIEAHPSCEDLLIMDKFVKKAFDKAINDAEFEKVDELFSEIGPAMVGIFVANSENKQKAEAFLASLMGKYEEELLAFAFVFFAAGYRIHEKA